MKRNFIIVAVFLSLMLVSCGGGGSSATINVTMTDFQFQPNQFTIPAGQEIAFHATNNGAVVHNFVIMKEGTLQGLLSTMKMLPMSIGRSNFNPVLLRIHRSRLRLIPAIMMLFARRMSYRCGDDC